MKTKNAIKDAMYAIHGKKGNDPEVMAICDTVPDSPQGVDEHDFLYGYTDQEGNYNHGIVELSKTLAKFFEINPDIQQMVNKLIGVVRGWGRHPSAFVVSTLDLSADRVPTMTLLDKETGMHIQVTQYDAGMVEKSGLVKADILGLSTLTAVSDCIELMKAKGIDYLQEENGVPLIYRLPEDPDVYTDFYNKDTDSSFQFNTELIKGMVQEFCLALTPGWRAGFFLPAQRFEAWSSWQPEANTVIAIDYAAERVDEIRMILLTLAARTEQQRGHFRVRVVLVERSAEGDWMNRLIGSRSDGYAIEAARYSVSHLTLGPLSDEQLWSSVRSLMQHAGKQPPAKEVLLARLREIDPLRRPLFAILAADALITGRNVRDWDRERLMRDVLARERERWAKMGVTSSYENLLALATMVGDLTEEALQNPPPGMALPAYKDFDREIYSVMTGSDLEGNSIPALKPDLIGEFFVLEHVKGRNERVTASQVADVLDLAWKVRGGSTRTDRFKVGMISVTPTNLPLFLDRLAIEDFADHVAAPFFLARPRAAGAAERRPLPVLPAGGRPRRRCVARASERVAALCVADHDRHAPRRRRLPAGAARAARLRRAGRTERARAGSVPRARGRPHHRRDRRRGRDPPVS
jgi:hypothetical protein